MSYIPITEAIKRLGKSDRQIRRMCHAGKLAYRYAPDKKLEISTTDIDKLTRRPLTAPELERLDRLESSLSQLREQLDILSTRVEALSRPQHQNPQKSIVGPMLRDLPPLQPGESLPDDYVPIYDLIKAHGLERRRNAIMRAMQPYLKKGAWRVAGHEVKNALDQEGVSVFLRRYGRQQ